MTEPDLSTCPWCGAVESHSDTEMPIGWVGQWRCGSFKHGAQPKQSIRCERNVLAKEVERLQREYGLAVQLLSVERKSHQAEVERLCIALARWMIHPPAECVPTQAIEMGRRALAGEDIADLDVVAIARKAEAEAERLRTIVVETFKRANRNTESHDYGKGPYYYNAHWEQQEQAWKDIATEAKGGK